MSRRIARVMVLGATLIVPIVLVPSAVPASAQSAVDFGPVTFYDTENGGSRAVVSADFDGDGFQDVASANEDADTITTLFGDGQGGLTLGASYAAGEQPWEIVAADVNDDGFPDLAAANATSGDVSIFLNQTDGTFTPEAAFPAGFTPSGITAADVDNDGFLDLITSNLDDNNVSVLVGDGTGQFAAPAFVGVGLEPTGVVSGDLTGDDISDVVVVNFSSDSVSVLVGPFDAVIGTFAEIRDVQVGFAPNRAALVDLNDDGSLDIAVHANSLSNFGPDYVSVLLNRGDGTFEPSVEYPAVGVRLASGITTGDFNHDGFGDVAVSGLDTDTIGVMLSDGQGRLGPATIFDADGPAENLVATNLRGAEGPDLVAGYIEASHVGVFLNDSPFVPPPAVPGVFNPVSPARLFDTRDGYGLPISGKLGENRILEVPVAGRLGVPATGVEAVALNVTVTEPDGPGWVTVFPCDGRPLASNVNFAAGESVPNFVLAPVSDRGTVCFSSSATTHLLADVSGWSATGEGYSALTPARSFDTRFGSGGVGAAKVGDDEVLEVPVTDRLGVPATGVAAVSLNVTVTQPDGPGWVTVFPCDTVPLASNLNFVAGEDVANAVIAPVSPDGTVCLYTTTRAHLLADVSGWFATDADYTGFQPERVFDTRVGTGGKLQGGQTLEAQIGGEFGIPATGVAGVVLNVTVTQPDGPGFITVFPCGDVPLASNLNFVAGQEVPNAVLAPVSPTGTVCFYASATTHILADVSGWFATAT